MQFLYPWALDSSLQGEPTGSRSRWQHGDSNASSDVRHTREPRTRTGAAWQLNILGLNLKKMERSCGWPIDYDSRLGTLLCPARERWAARVAYGGHWRSGDLSQWTRWHDCAVASKRKPRKDTPVGVCNSMLSPPCVASKVAKDPSERQTSGVDWGAPDGHARFA